MVIWSDEAYFCLERTFKSQNCRVWAKKNPRIHTEFPPTVSECLFLVWIHGDIPPWAILCGSRLRVDTVAEWYRYRIGARLVTSSNLIPLKTGRVGQRCTLHLSRAEASSQRCGVVVRRGGSSGVVHVTRPWFKMTWSVAQSPRVAEQCDVNIQ
ncbi:uncharacterized protein TNCV_3810531 [Trichonephila clavipes]|nr:uncharacterized protein TNCV_3810531 [Trichonephila clavipes]